MKSIVVTLAILAFSGVALCQQAPQLSTSDRIAFKSTEDAKTAAQKQYSEAQQAENQMFTEFAAVHPGWRINPQTFAVEKVVEPAKALATPPAQPKPATAPPVKPAPVAPKK